MLYLGKRLFLDSLCIPKNSGKGDGVDMNFSLFLCLDMPCCPKQQLPVKHHIARLPLCDILLRGGALSATYSPESLVASEVSLYLGFKPSVRKGGARATV